ncbi:MAG: prohibitin 2 [Candidatus Binatota bacterium]|jgi:regulator of protease activity HflC (stomatin/prohibitin superfamily)|nr:prohibitin 2 [Candidatus Binatota bacterium]
MEYQPREGMRGRIIKWSVIVIVLLLLLVTKPFVIVRAGEVGVIYSFGSIIGQVEEGFHLLAPWQFVTHTNIRVQRAVLERLQSFSQETQDVFVRASLNYQVSPKAVQNLFRTVGPDYYHVLIEPRVAQNFKDETVKYRSVEIAPNRESIRQSVRTKLEKELSPYSIHIVDLLLDNVDFSPEFKRSIENKQIATQKALEEEQLVAAERFKAQQRVETEKGEGEAKLARAEKEALANQKLSASLTPLLVQQSMIDKLAPKIQLMVVPQGQNFIMQLPQAAAK